MGQIFHQHSYTSRTTLLIGLWLVLRMRRSSLTIVASFLTSAHGVIPKYKPLLNKREILVGYELLRIPWLSFLPDRDGVGRSEQIMQRDLYKTYQAVTCIISQTYLYEVATERTGGKLWKSLARK